MLGRSAVCPWPRPCRPVGCGLLPGLPVDARSDAATTRLRRCARPRRRHFILGPRPRRGGDGGRRGLFQYRGQRISGNRDRSLLCRSDHCLHFSPHRQCRRESGGCRSHDSGGAWARPANPDLRAGELSGDPVARHLAQIARARRDFGGRHAAADTAHSGFRTAEWRHRSRSRAAVRHPFPPRPGPHLAGSRRDGSR